MRNAHPGVRTIVMLAAFGFVAGRCSQREAFARQSAKRGAEQKPVQSQDRGPELRLGKLERPPARVATLPVYFTAGQAKNVGSIRAELTIPKGAWIFQMAEAPAGSWWKVSSKEEAPPEGSAPRKNRGSVAFELTLSGGTRALPQGLVGYLHFELEPPGSPLPAGLTIRKIAAAPPESEAGRPGASGTPDIPANGPTNPVQSCFFFSH